MSKKKVQKDDGCLNSNQLAKLEASFRTWVEEGRPGLRLARNRILLIFLLIRYAGIKLSEVLRLDIKEALDSKAHKLSIPESEGKPGRDLALAKDISHELQLLLQDAAFCEYLEQNGLQVDPAFVRRKFYERADECGFAKQLGSPEMIRRARAVELMQANIPLPAVQQFLGQATAGLTTAYSPFDENTLQDMTAWFIEREGKQLSSARNTLHGRVCAVCQGTVQALVEVNTATQQSLRVIITMDSLKRLGVHEGQFVTAEIKAPWLHLSKNEPTCSADNCFFGEIVRITESSLVVEYIVRSVGGVEFCALLSRPAAEQLGLERGERAWVFFSCFAAVLHADAPPLPPSSN
ncbi:MAG: TOBE domain-containing protein [Desulfobulbus sp.]|jgi:molybdate transport system regulatory protein|nr:TOBE domain-containing protein [Desulfobulbaceae bacterium]